MSTFKVEMTEDRALKYRELLLQERRGIAEKFQDLVNDKLANDNLLRDVNNYLGISDEDEETPIYLPHTSEGDHPQTIYNEERKEEDYSDYVVKWSLRKKMVYVLEKVKRPLRYREFKDLLEAIEPGIDHKNFTTIIGQNKQWFGKEADEEGNPVIVLLDPNEAKPRKKAAKKKK